MQAIPLGPQNLQFPTPIAIAPRIYRDHRGYFYESFNEQEFKEKVADIDFVQDNQSKSAYGVLRGMHFQKPPYEQAKLVRVIKGAVLDIVIDIRQDSPTFGHYYTQFLSEYNHRQLFVPRGFAHGFVSLADDTLFQYKCDNYYNKDSEGSILATDPDMNLPWTSFVNSDDIIMSDKDLLAPRFLHLFGVDASMVENEKGD